MLKFNSRIEDYDCILSFDLAKKLSGYSLCDFKRGLILKKGVISTEGLEEVQIYPYLYSYFKGIIEDCKKFGVKFFVTKERLPNQAGPRSTIATLQELAKVHAVFDLAITHEDCAFYDYEGVHSVSVKSYFKKVTSLEKPTKEDIANYIKLIFPEENFDNMTYDVTDSIAVVVTLVNSKWNSDIANQVKEIKKEIKKYKTQNKIDKLQQEIDKVSCLKIEKEYLSL